MRWRPPLSAGRTARSRRRGTASARELVPGDDVGGREPDDQGERVARTACQNVNHATWRSAASAITSCSAPAVSERPMIAATGHKKNTPRKPSGITTRNTRQTARSGTRRARMLGTSTQHDPRPLVDPLVAMRPDGRRAQRELMRGLHREFHEHRSAAWRSEAPDTRTSAAECLPGSDASA